MRRGYPRIIRRGRIAALLASIALVTTVTVRPTAMTVELVPEAQAFDPVSFVWSKFRDGVLKKIVDLIKSPVEKAKAGLKRLIDKALAALQKVFENDVIIPALVWAIPKVFPQADKFLKVVQQIVGGIERLKQTAQKYTAAVDALIQGNRQKYGEALAGIESSMDLVQKLDASRVVDIVIAIAKENAPAFIKAKTIDLLERAYGIIEGPINAGKAAACSAIGSIPIVGGLLSGAADFIITEGLKLLRRKGFEFIGGKAAELANGAIDAIGKQLKGFAARVDDRIRPVLDRMKGFLAQAEKYLAPIRTAYAKVKMGLDLLKNKGGLGSLVGIQLARTLYDEFLKLARNNLPSAKKKLQELADKARAVFPAAGSLAGPVLDALGDAGASFVDEATQCRDRITGFDETALKAVFGCLKGAVEKALAFAGFDAFHKLLASNVPEARKKLLWLADKLVAVFPAARAVAAPVIAGLTAGGDALVAETGRCRARIQGFDKVSAQGVLTCLADAVKKAGGAALVGAARGLYDEFIMLLRTGCDRASAKLRALVGKVVGLVPQVKSISEPILSAIGSGCAGGVDRIANLKQP